MRFGLWYDFRNPSGSGRTDAELYAETLEQIVYAEELGFDDIWLSEHHLAEDGYLPSCLTVAAAIAARTRRVTIGATCCCCPSTTRSAWPRTGPSSTSSPTVGSSSAPPSATGWRSSPSSASTGATAGRSRRRRWGSCAAAGPKKSSTTAAATSPSRRCAVPPSRCSGPSPCGSGRWRGRRRAARIGDGLLGGARAYGEYVAALRDYGKDHTRPHFASSGGRFLFCSEEPGRDWERLKPHALHQMQPYFAKSCHDRVR